MNVKNDKRAIRNAQRAIRQGQRPGISRAVWDGLVWATLFSLGIVAFFAGVIIGAWKVMS